MNITESTIGQNLPDNFKLSVLVPVYNERATIAEILSRIKQSGFPKEIVVVDDASTDGTREFLQSLNSTATEKGNDVKVFYHQRNQGKGAALRTAMAHATGDVLVVQDADLEYHPRDYPRLLAPILEGNADVVYGSRFFGSEPHRVIFFWHFVGNRFLTFFSNMMTNLNLSDMETGLKAFRKEVLQGIRIESDRFNFEPEITAKVARHRWRVYEVTVSYSGRDYAHGKKIGWKDGVAAIVAIFRYRFFA